MGTNERVMPKERDEESGKYVEHYPPAAVIDAIRDADGMASTQDVVDRLGSSYETAYKKLRALEDSGDVQSRKVANARLWMLPADNDEDGE
jgi:Fe2+ or Zn2+ uptake regulation protein